MIWVVPVVVLIRIRILIQYFKENEASFPF